VIGQVRYTEREISEGYRQGRGEGERERGNIFKVRESLKMSGN
jgi:hypothetical protein